MLLYLVTIRPMIVFLCKHVLEVDLESEFLWIQSDSSINALKLRNEFTRFFAGACGEQILFNDYRHAVQAFGEKHLRSKSDAWNDVFNEQFGHSAKTGLHQYARSSLEINGVSRDQFESFKLISDSWHQLLGFSPANVQTQVSTPVLGTPNKLSSETQTVTTINQVNLILPNGRIYDHNGLIKQENFTDLAGELYFKLNNAVVTKFGFEGFTSNFQAKSCLKVYENNQDLLIVMPTGAGKSLTVLLPCSLELSRVTVVVVPIIGLKTQYIELCKAKNIKASIWSSRIQPQSAEGLIIVSVEIAVRKEFMNFLSSLAILKRLCRIVVDECHLVLTQSDFRHAFQLIHCLRCHPVQLVLLSATVPQEYENKLRIIFASEFLCIRMPSTKWNMSYSVIEFTNESSMIAEVLNRAHVHRLIVFVKSKDKAVSLCKEMNAASVLTHVYTSQQNDVERKKLLREFEQNNLQCIVATSAMSVGVDVSNANHVIHFDIPFSMIDYVQECGRAGRNDNLATCEIFKLTTSKTDDEGLRAFIKGNVCRRSIITRYLDGEPVYCFQSGGSNKCDVCLKLINDRKRSPDTKDFSGKSLIHSASKKIRFEDEKVQDSTVTNSLPNAFYAKSVLAKHHEFSKNESVNSDLAILSRIKSEGCVVCSLMKSKAKHDLFRCPFTKKLCLKCVSSSHARVECEFRKLEHGLCFSCGLPSAASSVQIHDQNSYGRTCKSVGNDVVLPIVWFIWRDNYKRAFIKNKIPELKPITNDLDYFKWFQRLMPNQLPFSISIVKIAVEENWLTK
jgi:superfamily II DNA helicase RecQ